MIKYDPGNWSIWFAFTLKGSVFQKAAVWAFPCAFTSVILHIIVRSQDDLFNKLGAGDVGASVLTGFTFILGFLVVFRSQQAYSRWWEGGTLLQQLRGEWFNAFSSLMAFCNKAPEKQEEVSGFQHSLARLFSLLYCTALEQVSTMEKKNYELIDIEDFDAKSMEYMLESHDRCEVCLQWIQRLITDANESQLLKVAPPILSRVYNQLGNGIVNLNNARKITEFPIPFPLAQMITFMLLFHWLITAFVCAASVDRSFWAGILSFIVTFSFWCINYIAVELEQPFGDDANDLPLHDMQEDLNKSIKALMDKLALTPPSFNHKKEHKNMLCRAETMDNIFKDLANKQMAAARVPAEDVPDKEKSPGNAMVLESAAFHFARPKEPDNKEVWIQMGPKADNKSLWHEDVEACIWRQDFESSWKTESKVSEDPLHNALPVGSDAPTVSPQVCLLPDLPVPLRPPVWEPISPSAALRLTDLMFGATTSENPRPAYRAPGISTTATTTATRDAAPLPSQLQAPQEQNDAAPFSPPLSAPSTVWGSDEHGTSDQVIVASRLPSDLMASHVMGMGLGGARALTNVRRASRLNVDFTSVNPPPDTSLGKT